MTFLALQTRVIALIVAVATCIPALAATPFNPGPSSISVTEGPVSCVGDVPVLNFTLYVNAQDAGRPGLMYVGAHDQMQSQAAVLNQSGGWEAFSGAMLTPYVVARGGLSTIPVRVPLPNAGAWQGWSIYLGYGALTPQGEQTVQQAVVAVANAKAKWPDRTIPAVDADHFSRSLIQEDMRKFTKYRLARTVTPELASMCKPTGGN